MFGKRKMCADCGRPLGDSSKQKGGMSPKMCIGNCGGRKAPPPPGATKPKSLTMENKIAAYKKLCELADVPQFFIDNPEMIFAQPLSEPQDILWAKKIISIHKKVDDFIDPSIH